MFQFFGLLSVPIDCRRVDIASNAGLRALDLLPFRVLAVEAYRWCLACRPRRHAFSCDTLTWPITSSGRVEAQGESPTPAIVRTLSALRLHVLTRSRPDRPRRRRFRSFLSPFRRTCLRN